MIDLDFKKNTGNYVMTYDPELLAEFDPFLDVNIKRHGNKGSGTTSYLSSKICDEMINIMAEKVINTIMTEIKLAKKFSIAVGSTPDISHVDQLSFIVRYVSEDGCTVERFLRFIPVFIHSNIHCIILMFIKVIKVN